MVAELKNKIEHYFKLVVRSTRDNIPKLVGYFLVKGCQVFNNNFIIDQNAYAVVIKFNVKPILASSHK